MYIQSVFEKIGQGVALLICLASLSFTLNFGSVYGQFLVPWSSFGSITNFQPRGYFSTEFTTALLLFLALLLSLAYKKESEPIGVVEHILTEDERKILETLLKEGGSATQKKLSYKTGLNKVRIHRLVTRLAERNILTAERRGKANHVTIREWLSSKS